LWSEDSKLSAALRICSGTLTQLPLGSLSGSLLPDRGTATVLVRERMPPESGEGERRGMKGDNGPEGELEGEGD